MKNVNFSWFNAIVAVAFNIVFVLKFHQAVSEPSVFKNTDFYNLYELKFILLLLGMFFFYLAATYGIAKRKNRGFWYRYIGVFGPLGLVIAAFLKKFEHEPVLTEEEGAEEEEEQEENMEVKNIKVRTRDGKILNMKTVGEMPEEVKKEGGEVISEDDQKSENSDTEKTEENQNKSNEGQSQNTDTYKTNQKGSQKNSNDRNYSS